MAEADQDQNSIFAPNYDSAVTDRSKLGEFAKIAAKDGTLLEKVEISVSEQEKRQGASAMGMKDQYTVYLVETRTRDDSKGVSEAGPTALWRRYSEFELLRNYLVVAYAHVVVPPLPEKRMTIMWQQLTTVDNFDADFIERRRVGLEGFLQRVASHPAMCAEQIFHGFLEQEDGWKESVLATGFQAKQDSRLKSLNAQFRLKKPDRQFEELKNYATDLQSNITTLLKTRAKLADRLYGIHKIHGNYGRVFSEWSGIEQEMGDGLQSAGHFMDAYKDYIDDFLSEEEQIADQLKEYIYFAESLKNVCRKQEVLQYELERAEENLASRSLQRDQILGTAPTKAFSLRSMRSKIFGPESQEAKDAQVKLLEDQIEEGEETVTKATKEVESFMEKALTEVDRFKKQRMVDLKEIFINYAILQIKISKRGITTWNSTRDCFLKM